MGIKLSIKLLAFVGAPESEYSAAVERLNRMISPDDYELQGHIPDILFFLTGGSERLAAEWAIPDHYYVLLGSGRNNSGASATEVKAYLNRKGIPSVLLDEDEPGIPMILSHLLAIKRAMGSLKGQRLGLIGQISDWLIASAVRADVLRAKLGIELVEIPWADWPSYSGFEVSKPFMDHFPGDYGTDLTPTARVDSLLGEMIRVHRLDALTVECFPLVRQEGVTACLPLARMNDIGFPAGCEGDLTAIAGMMLGKALTGTVPWMANLNTVSEEGCLFSHCTIAPGMISGLRVRTHFETGLGTALSGYFQEDRVTVFRFDQDLSRAFIATAPVIGRPSKETACRTQIEIKLASREVQLLRADPLGNHHLFLPGDCTGLLGWTCRYLGIVLQS